MNLRHLLNLCGCRTGESWHVNGRCVPLVTPQYEREQAALRELSSWRRFRRAVVQMAGKQVVR